MAQLLEVFLLLLGIIDPIASVVAFLSLTNKMSDKEKTRVAIKAVSVAAIVFFVFAVGGGLILKLLGVSIDSFKAAGGIILILLGVQMSLGLTFPKDKEEVSEIAVVIGTPLISGPATITTTMILVGDYGFAITAIAGAAALLLTLLALVFSTYLNKLMGRSGLQVLSTMMGIITIAWGLQFLFGGARALL